MKNCRDSLPEAWGPWEPQYAPPARSMSELWISDGFEWFFALNYLYPNLLSSLDPSNSYSCLSQWSFDQIFWFVVSKAICCGISQTSPTFPCKQGHEAMKNSRDSLPEAWGPWEPQYAPLQYPVSKSWIVGYWFWSRLSYIASASSQRRVVQIQLLASVGWKWGCQPFSWRCLQNVTHCRKEIWSPRFFTIQWLCPRFGLQDIDWLCSQLWHVTAANQWTVVEIELLATVGWKWGCQTFSCSCSQNVMHCRKEIWSPRFLRYSDYVQDLDYRILIACALSCDMWRLPTNEQWSKLILQQ